MNYTILFAGILFLFSIIACRHTSPQMARAELYNSQGEKVGNAVLTEAPEGVKIAIQLSNLPPGIHGFHIHTFGKCDLPDFKSAGGHFNPDGKKHGLENPEGSHAGDLPNLSVRSNGTADMEVVAKQVTLGSGNNSLFHPNGTALVIHADPDDEKTDPAGNSGSRIACGVIERVGEQNKAK